MLFILISIILGFQVTTTYANETSIQSENASTMYHLLSEDDNFSGYFCIPDVGINVPIYYINYDVWTSPTIAAQNYTDLENAATLLEGWTNYLIVADHIDQSFQNLPSVEVGSTAFIQWYDNTILEFVCVETGVGLNDGYELYDQNGSSYYDWDCDLVTYTCNHDFVDGITFSKWKYKPV